MNYLSCLFVSARPLLLLLFVCSLNILQPQQSSAAFPIKDNSAVWLEHTNDVTTATAPYTPAGGELSQENKTKAGLSIASLALGIFGAIALPVAIISGAGALGLAGGVAALLALIFGAIGSGGEKHATLGTIGMIMGIAELGLLLLIGILALLFIGVFFAVYL